MRLCLDDGNMDFIFGSPANQALNRLGAPLMQKASALHAYRQHLAKGKAISNTRLFDEFRYAAGSWPSAFRVIHKAEAMDLGDNPRFIVTSLELPSPEIAYTELYCSRGNAERYINLEKAVGSARRVEGIDLKGVMKKCVVTLLVMSTFFI